MAITNAQKKLLGSDFILELLLKKIPASIFWKDKDSVYLGCNDAFARSLGVSSAAEIIGKTDYDLPTTKEESDAFRADDKQVIDSKTAKYNIEEFQTLRDGKRVALLTNKVPLFDKKNNVIGILGIYYDITERKRKEQELQEAKEKAEIASKIKTEFLENMRHDIRTPLTGIIGFAELLKSELTDPKMKEYASNLAASGYALTNLLNEVLEIIKVSSGEVPILKKKFSLHKKLKEVVLLNQAAAMHKKINLSLDFDPTIPDYLIGDSARIHRIILELITNAINFTHKGSVKLSARLAKNHEDNVIIKIIVDDTGIGIPPEKQQDIYLQFKRLTPSYEGIYKGSGLGLSIAKQLVDDVNGEIYVESQVGVGSKFTFIVKLKKALLDEELGSDDLMPPSCASNKLALPVNLKTEANSLTETTNPYKSRILVVEDNPIAAHVVTKILSKMNCTVDLAQKGKEAVELTEHTVYDLIFMDIGLPDIDGYEVTKRIRLNEINKNHVPIIALTAHTCEENKKYCIDIGINAVLTKPLIQEKAEDILNSFIAYRREKLTSKNLSNFLDKTTSYHELATFDFNLIKSQFGHDEEVAIQMVTLFLEELPKELENIQTAYRNKDWPSLQQLAHKIRGGVSYCGMPRLKEACDQLEHTLRNEKHSDYEKIYDQLIKTIALTEKDAKEKIFLILNGLQQGGSNSACG